MQLKLTDLAVEQFQIIMKEAKQETDDIIGLRIGVQSVTENKFDYFMEYAIETDPNDSLMEVDGLKIFIDAGSTQLLDGAILTFVDNENYQGFAFDNPNEPAN